MTNDELKKSISTLRAKLENQLKSVIKLGDYTQVSTDNGDLSIDGNIDIGSSVYTLDDNGNLTPAEDGEYTATDGKIITVTDGKISNIGGSAPSDDTTTSTDTDMDKEALADSATAPTDAPATTDDSGSDIENRVSALEQQVSAITDAVNQIMQILNDSTSMSQELMNKVEALAKAPATKPIEVKKSAFNSNSINDEMDAIRKMKNNFLKNGITMP